MCTIPFYHVAGLLVSLVTELILGSKLLVLSKFEPHLFLETISKHKVVYMYILYLYILDALAHCLPLPGLSILFDLQGCVEGNCNFWPVARNKIFF